MNGFIRRHPRVLLGASVVAIGVSLYGLLEAVEAYHLARQVVGDIQRQRSEALGG